MARPKADDPKVSVSIRVKRSVLDAYQARSADWREAMHTALERWLEPSAPEIDRQRAALRERMAPSLKTNAVGVQFGPQETVPGSRLKGKK